MATKSAARWESEAFQSQRQAEQYRDMARLLVDNFDPGDILAEQVARLLSLAIELDEDANERFDMAHHALTGRG